jgi:MFS family permease
MAGLLTASIVSGRAITRIGYYRPFPIAGTAVTTIGMFLLSRLEADTEPWLASVYMLVLGIGIGLVMQVLVLAVQNDAPPKDMGVATSTATFFRSMGGSLGVALFGAIFASRLGHELARLGPEAAQFSAGVNLSPEQVHALDPTLRHEFLLAFVSALQPVFLVGAILTAAAFALSWRLKERPLRVNVALES